MPRVDYAQIIQSKNFYRDAYRKAVTMLAISFFLMVLLIMWAAYEIEYARKPTFYATNSAGFIVQLKPLSEPNKSSKPLLKPDPVEEGGIKELNID